MYLKLNIKNLSRALCLAAILSAGAAAAAAAGTVDAGNGWTCTADKIKNAKYDGSARAYIHLDPYSKGDRYKVAMNAAKTEATGTTGNDTPFVCKKG